MSTHWEQKEFEAAAQAMLARTSRSLPEATNQALANVAGRIINLTAAADKSKIQRQLGEIGRLVEYSTYKDGKKKGQTKIKRGGRIYAQANNKRGGIRAAMIINARRARAGKPGLEGKEMEKAIRNMVGARKKSAGFMKSGNIPGYQKLLGGVSKPFKIAKLAGFGVRGKDKGDAKPAPKFTLSPVAYFENTTKAAETTGAAALRRAMADEAKEMRRHIAEKLNPDIKQFNKH